MTDPWNLTEAQRLQFREARGEAKRKQMAGTPSTETPGIGDRLLAAQAELEELAAQSREAYQRWQELDRQVTGKADEIRELKRKIRLA